MRSSLAAALSWVLLLVLFFWLGPRLDPGPIGEIAPHTIGADSWTGEQIARLYGWDGDWREYAQAMRRINHWREWPTLHLGEVVWVIDCRTPPQGEEREDAQAAGSPTGPDHTGTLRRGD